jgi:anti-sigma factor RsiW
MKPHKELTHLQARKLIHLDMDASLDDDQRKQLDLHLEGCSECRSYVDEMTQIDTRVKQSLQGRFPQSHPKEVELTSTLAPGKKEPDEAQPCEYSAKLRMGSISYPAHRRLGLDD